VGKFWSTNLSPEAMIRRANGRRRWLKQRTEAKIARRRELILLLEAGEITNRWALARVLGVHRSTIQQDLAAIRSGKIE